MISNATYWTLDKTWLTVVLLSGLALLTGCPTEDEVVDGMKPVRFASAAEVKSLDPHVIHDLTSIRIAEGLFETLLRHNPQDMSLVPGAAERYDISNDGRVYTFYLRESARWSDGTPVTAHDFYAGWQRALMPDTGGYYPSLFHTIEGAQDFYTYRLEQLGEPAQGENITERRTYWLEKWQEAREVFEQMVGIRIVDDRTLEVTLNEPTAYFPQLVAFITFAPAPAHMLDDWQQLDPDSGSVRIAEADIREWAKHYTNGPYVLERWRFRQDMTLVQNSEYWHRDAMQNVHIHQQVIESPQTQLLRYQRGTLDWLPDIPTASTLAADLLTENRPDVHDMPGAGTYYYLFNCGETVNGRNNPLADARVRKALAMTINREQIVSQVTRMHQPTALTMTPVDVIPGYEPPVEAGAEYNPARARELLAEAGYPDGEGLEPLSILYNTEGAHEAVAQVIRRTWERELGVRVSLEGVEWGRLLDRRNRRDFTIMRAGWFGDYMDPTTFLDMYVSDNPSNDTQYSNEQFDALYAQAQQTVDETQRFELLREAEAIILEEAPIAPIYQYTIFNVFDPQRVHGVHPNPWQYRRLDQIRVD